MEEIIVCRWLKDFRAVISILFRETTHYVLNKSSNRLWPLWLQKRSA